eukprot:c33648_g1_i1.p1 GENE.c33648_g1_i1~~c33648_g1_i1.p1  ORF type:complete len:273 (+),score=25.49 c33648_g1_i1:3-821(+)
MQTFARLRLACLAGGDQKSTALPSHVQSFQQAMDSMKSWSAPGTFISFRDDQSLAGTLVQCYQSNGLCSRRAPIVLQHYLVCKSGSLGNNSGMVDLTLWVRSNLAIRDVFSQLFRGGGDDDSFDVLSSLMVEGTKISYLSPSNVTEIFLREHGPCLVSQFMVYDEFARSPQLEFCGVPDSRANEVGRHAMVLVGTRVDEGGTRHFLLQNWWASKQFIDVDETYLDHCCNALVYYVGTPQHRIPERFPVHFSNFVHNVFDTPERDKKETCVSD